MSSVAWTKEREQAGHRGHAKPMAGKRFGRLLILSRAPNNKSGEAMWNAICDCGAECVVPGPNVRSGRTKSCGCINREQSSDRMSTLKGELSPRWKSELSDADRHAGRMEKRSYPEYAEWRKAVFEHDNYTCQRCGDSRGHNLNAHHIEGFTDNVELRTELSNGITFCDDCHKDLHRKFGDDVGRENLETWWANSHRRDGK